MLYPCNPANHCSWLRLHFLYNLECNLQPPPHPAPPPQDMAPARRFRFLRLDLGERGALCGALQRAAPRPDLVMHFAAVAYVGAWLGGRVCVGGGRCGQGWAAGG